MHVPLPRRSVIRSSFYFTNLVGIVHGKNLEDALQWLTEHLEDPDIDQPYMVRKRDTIPKVPLTAEQRAQKLEEMKVAR